VTHSARHTSAIGFLLTLGLAAVPAASLAQDPPPPPPPRQGDGTPPPRPGDGPPPPRPGGGAVTESRLPSDGDHAIIGEVWVDNWFKLHVNGAPLLEDSVAYKTERSFNAERFEFQSDLPMTLAFEFRDFMQNETGLEYIGTQRQQMGDGGAIAQFKEADNSSLLAVTDADWRCLVVQSAPAAASCAAERNPDVSTAACAQTRVSVPDNWMSPDFDDRAWPRASVHSVRDVRPKDGYDRIDWAPSAQLIWSPDLEKDNILYCRVKVTG